MSLQLKERFDLLKALMIEDRQEIRTIRLSLYHSISALAFASFAISGVLANGKVTAYAIHFTIDLILLAIIWGVFVRLKVDLYHARQCQMLREKLIVDLDRSDAESLEFLPFQKANEQQPTITDSELKWLPILSSCAITAKLCLLFFALPYLAKAL